MENSFKKIMSAVGTSFILSGTAQATNLEIDPRLPKSNETIAHIETDDQALINQRFLNNELKKSGFNFSVKITEPSTGIKVRSISPQYDILDANTGEVLLRIRSMSFDVFNNKYKFAEEIISLLNKPKE